MKKIFSFLTAILFAGSMWAAVTPLSLPKAWNESDGSSAYTEALGCTKTSLGSDYSSAPKLKFNAAGSCLLIQVADSPDEISFNFKQNGTTAGTFKVQESADGKTFTDALTVTWPGNSKTSTPKASLKASTRYIQLIYVTKGNSTNAAVGGVSITKAATTPAASFVDGDTKAISSYELAAAGETDAWAVAYSNIKADSEGENPEVAVYSNAECTTEFTGDWFEAVADGANSVMYSADANETGETRTVYVVFSNTAKNASDGDVNLTDTLTVSQPTLVLVTSVDIKAATELEVGETETLTVTVLPEGASDKTVTWESDKESVATVDENGKVTAVAPGKANITATANDGSGKSATCVVTVIEALEKSTLTFTEKYSTGGANATGDVTWTVESDASSESDFDNNRGIHFGTGSSVQVTYIQLSTSDITGTIKKVIVNASTANDVSATVSVKVGGNAFGGDAQSLTSSATNYTFAGSAKGEIVVLITKPEKAYKALYCKSIVVKYDDTTTAIDNTEASVKAVKVLREGQIFILRGEKVYTVQGQLVK